MKTCARCGTEFTPGSNRARYCGSECRKAVRNARAPKAEPVGVVGSRREGFAFRVSDPATGRTIEGRWRPRYLDLDESASRDRLPYIDTAESLQRRDRFGSARRPSEVDRAQAALQRPRRRKGGDNTEDLAGLATFEGSRHGGGIRAVSLRDDVARRWAIKERGEDIGAGL